MFSKITLTIALEEALELKLRACINKEKRVKTCEERDEWYYTIDRIDYHKKNIIKEAGEENLANNKRTFGYEIISQTLNLGNKHSWKFFSPLIQHKIN